MNKNKTKYPSSVTFRKVLYEWMMNIWKKYRFAFMDDNNVEIYEKRNKDMHKV